jgi:Domain of unknown function (DUF1918)
VKASTGDRIVVETAGLDRTRREGEVLDVLGSGDVVHYRVRWSDGHESIYCPGADAHVVEERG